MNPPAAITAVSNTPITAERSSTQTGGDTTPKSSPAPAIPCVSRDAYNTTQPEQLYSLLMAVPSTVTNGTTDLWEIAPDPADYSLADIEEVLTKV